MVNKAQKRTRHDEAAERIELRMIADDAADAVRVLLAPGADGLLSIIAFPLGGLVAEESFAYFDARNRVGRIGSLDGTLLTDFRHSVKKVRARLKLFDDNDTGQEALVSFMDIVRAQSRVLFSHPTSGLLQALSRPFRPDLGAFFAGDHLIGTSHTSLPTMGVMPELIEGLLPGAFEDLNKFARDFGKALAEHFGTLRRVLESQGLAVDFKSGAHAHPVAITYNDFVGDKFYQRAEVAIPGARPQTVAGLTLCAAQANACLEVFPKALSADSNLLLRVQFLTAYHGTSALRKCLTSPPDWVPREVGIGFEIPRLRNLLAHYELRAAQSFAIDAEQPLQAAIAGVSGLGPELLRAQVVERLQRIRDFLTPGLTKSSLRPFRALLGCHS